MSFSSTSSDSSTSTSTSTPTRHPSQTSTPSSPSSEYHTASQSEPQHRRPRRSFSRLVAHIFTPNTLVSSPPSSCPQTPDEYTAQGAVRIVADDEYVLVEEGEEDGGPICREAEIEGWKRKGKVVERG